MKIAVVIGSRADAPGMLAVADSLAEQNVWVFGHRCGPAVDMVFDNDSVKVWKEWPDSDVDAVVLLGDRFEIVQAALEYRNMLLPIAHIHAGEITGQEPDDTYRHIITRMSTWAFVPHETAEQFLTLDKQFGATPWGTKVFNCGSPFITAAAKAERLNVSWPCDGKKVMLCFNPLPEDKTETHQLAQVISQIRIRYPNHICIGPNTDRHRNLLGVENISISHNEYISYMASADVIIGNSSSGLIENSVIGTPYLCVGSRQVGRISGNNVVMVEPQEVMTHDVIIGGKYPDAVYGEADSADRIAKMLIGEIKK